MTEASETTTTFNGVLNGPTKLGVRRWRERYLSCRLVTGGLYGSCRSHLLVGMGRLPETHEEWEIRGFETKSERVDIIAMRNCGNIIGARQRSCRPDSSEGLLRSNCGAMFT